MIKTEGCTPSVRPRCDGLQAVGAQCGVHARTDEVALVLKEKALQECTAYSDVDRVVTRCLFVQSIP